MAPQVTAEGGLDAAQEAPYIFAAMDALAARAASWAERRQRLLQERNCEGADSLSPHSAAVAAAAALKQVLTCIPQCKNGLTMHRHFLNH